MATATLTFDLSDINDEQLHRQMLAGPDLGLALIDILSDMRIAIKHEEPTQALVSDTTERWRSRIYETLRNYGCDLNLLFP